MLHSNWQRVGLHLVSMLVFSACATFFITSSWADDSFPIRPIHLVVPFSAGGIVDLRARYIAERVTKNVGQSVIVENRLGGAGIIGSDFVAKATPDGYTLLMSGGSSIITTAALSPHLPFDPFKDLLPITQHGTTPFVLVVHPSLGIKSVKDLIALAKAKPGQLSYASQGPGSAANVAGEVFKHEAGIDVLHVSYKGDAPALNDVVAGHVQMTFNFPATSIEFIKAGRLIPLMQTGRKRLAILPDVPTAIEVGLPGAALAPWGGIWAPAKISHERAQWLNTQFRRVLESEDYSRYMQSSGSEPHSNSLSEFAAFFESERVKWTDLIKKTGVKLE